MTNVKDFIIKDGVLIKYTGSDANVIIPDGVTEIGEEAFKSNKNLETVVIPNGVTCIGVSAFENCENLTSVTNFDSVEHICAYAFMNTGLANIVIQNGIIDWMAFHGCTSLTNVTLGNNVTKIGSYAFDEGVNLYSNSKKVTHEFNMGYGGFFSLKSQIANAFDEEFGKHYSQLLKASRSLSGGDEAFNQKTNQILADKRFEGKDDILDFFFANDCEGTISYQTCKKLYDIIKDVDFKSGFQYRNFSNGIEKDWNDLKEFFLGCYKAKVSARWC